MKKILLIFFISIFVFSLFAQEKQLGDEKLNIIIILDCSKSMNKIIDGKRKIDIAKSKIAELIQKNRSAKFSLITFGEKDLVDCANAKIVFDLDYNNKEKILNYIKEINGIGNSPLIYAYNIALLILSEHNISIMNSKIILFSDGIGNCNQRIVETNINPDVFLVDFLLNEKDKTQLMNMIPSIKILNNDDNLINIFENMSEKGNQKNNSNETNIEKEGKKKKIQEKSKTTFIQAKLLTDIKNFSYNKIAKKYNIQGKVKLQLIISKNGTVSQSEVVLSSGHDILDNYAIYISKKLEFETAKKNNQPIQTTIIITITFSLKD